jgi:hypothetical protein
VKFREFREIPKTNKVNRRRANGIANRTAFFASNLSTIWVNSTHLFRVTFFVGGCKEQRLLLSPAQTKTKWLLGTKRDRIFYN